MRTAFRLACLLLGLAVLCVPCHTARAQCDPHWLRGESLRGVNGTVYAMVQWDLDGDGPLPPKVVIAGSFSVAGAVFANNIAVWDPESGAWSTLNTGTSGPVYALAVMPNGDLLAAGNFANAGGVSVKSVARWNGTAWSALGTGIGAGTVYSLAVMPNGELIAGGSFSLVGVTTARRIARWDGVKWNPIGKGMVETIDTAVYALAVMADGRLIAGGKFQSQDQINTFNIVGWDGTSWNPLAGAPQGITDGEVRALRVLVDGTLAVGGTFSNAGGAAASRIVVWDGTNWTSLGSGADKPVNVFILAEDGALIAGGEFGNAGGVSANRIARWSNSIWSAVGGGVSVGPSGPVIKALVPLANGHVLAGGSFSRAEVAVVSSIARFDGQHWTAVGQGFDNDVRAFAVLPSGDLVAAGSFSAVGGQSQIRIAKWNGISWTPLALDVDGQVTTLGILPGGELVAGGMFTTIDGTSANRIARWDGAAWHAMSSGMSGSVQPEVRSLVVLPSGNLIAAGSFTSAGGVSAVGIASWNGVAWSPLGLGLGSQAIVFTVALLQNGDLVAGGSFSPSGGNQAKNVARWNGAVWSAFGPGVNGQVLCLAVLSNGNLVAGGSFTGTANTTGNTTTLNYVGLWDGTLWSQMGHGLGSSAAVRALATLANGDLVATGTISSSGALPLKNIARWNGADWSALGAGLTDVAYALAVLPSRELIVGGHFLGSGSTVSPYWARWSELAKPWIASSPMPSSVLSTSTVSLSAVCATDYENVSFQWQRNNVDITDGPEGAAEGGGTVTGASGSLPSPTNGVSVTLTIADAQCADTGAYSVRMFNACGSVTSPLATITVQGCEADLNGDSLVDDSDFQVFVLAYNILDCTDPTMPAGCAADLNGDHVVDDSDFSIFVVAYDALVCP